MASLRKLKQIMHNIYVALYKNSTPSADFDELVKNATINERGQKEIDFMAYEIDYALFDELMNKEIANWMLTEREKRDIKSAIYLGCSPKYKND